MLWLIFARVLIMSAVMSVTGIFVMLVSRLIEKSVSKKQIYLLWVVPIMAAIIPVSGVFNSNITKSENSGVYTQSVFVGEPVTQGSETAAVPETDENTAGHAPRAVREDRAADKTAAAQSTVFERIAQIPPKTAAANSGAMHLSGGGKNIKERIKTIMSPQDRRTGAKKANTAAFLNVLCFVLVAFRLDAAVSLNTYMANKTAAIYSVRYYAGEDSWCSMAGRVKNSNATLVNSKMYRSFSADINTDLYNALNKKTLTAKIHVRMDRLLKELDGGDYSLNFCYYNSEPYIRADMIFLTVRVQGDKIIYTDCTDDIQENKNYSGEEGFRLMNNSISVRVGKIFED